jgi:hypothetical protein
MEIQDHYRLGAWKGIPVYFCVHCPFDTMDETALAEHYQTYHAPPPSPVLIADKRGREVPPETTLILTPENAPEYEVVDVDIVVAEESPRAARRKKRTEVQS